MAPLWWRGGAEPLGESRTYLSTRFPSPDRWDEQYSKLAGPMLYRCPEVASRECGYAYNGGLSALPSGALRDDREVVLLFESDLGWNGQGGAEAVCWGRHHREEGDRANAAFVDGHVTACARAQLDSGDPWGAEDPTPAP